MPRCRVVLLALLFLVFVAPARSADSDYKERINGALLHFRVRGDDPKNPYLLILHGGPGFSAHMFYPWGGRIEKAMNVVYLDQRGCGESERLTFKSPLMPTTEETAEYTIPTLLKDIEGVRQFLKIDQWYVLGHSWGGMLGLEYVTAYPNAVKGFLFVDGLFSQPRAQEAILNFAEKKIAEDEKSTQTEQQERAKRLKPFLPYARKLTPGRERLMSVMQFAFALFGDIYYADAKTGAAYNAKIREALQPYKLSPSVTAPANEPVLALMATEHYAQRDDSSLLPKVACRTLVINGKQDGIIPPADAEVVQKGIKGAALLLLDRCGHFPFAEQPEAFAMAILDFVREGQSAK